MNDPFDLEEQFDDFLGKAGPDWEEMGPKIKEQLKKAFYAGCGRTLLILNDHAANLEKDDAVSVIDHLFRQVHGSFLNDLMDDGYKE